MSEPGPRDPFGRRNARIRKQNKEIAQAHGCIVTGASDGIEPAHWPYSQKDGAGWGLGEIIPLHHNLHRALDLGDPSVVCLVDICARLYYNTVYRIHREDPSIYWGPPWRVKELEDALREAGG